LRSVDRESRAGDDYVVVPSPRIGAIYTEVFGHAPRAIIPPPVSSAWFGEELRHPQNYFVWAGRIVEPVKRLGFLIELFRQRSDKTLVIVGDGRDRRKLEAVAPSNVVFVGWQGQAEVRKWFGMAKALLLPSMEDFGLVAAEAMAVGVPTILTTDAGSSEWIRDSSIGVVAPLTIRGFGAALDFIESDELSNRESLRRYALDAFSQSTFNLSLERAYNDFGWA